MSQGFPKSYRLLKRQEFLVVYSTGTPYRNAGFHLFLRKREDIEPSRLGLTVTRFICKAVIRNRLRRWARETIRTKRQNLARGFDIVINYHRILAGKSRHEFDALLQDILQKASLLPH